MGPEMLGAHSSGSQGWVGPPSSVLASAFSPFLCKEDFKIVPLSPFYIHRGIFTFHRTRECPLPLPGHLSIPRKGDELIS